MWGGGDFRHLSLKIGIEAAKKKSRKRCHAQIIPNQFEKITHINFRILKVICSIALSSN
jgi:hypothetical protein